MTGRGDRLVEDMGGLHIVVLLVPEDTLDSVPLNQFAKLERASRNSVTRKSWKPESRRNNEGRS